MSTSSVSVHPTGILPGLLVSYAPREARDWHRLVWVLDERLAHIVRTVREPAIGAIRMAWWREALVAHDLTKGKSEPLVEAWRALPRRTDADQAEGDMINGWLVLANDIGLSDADLRAYAEGRGGGLFSLLAPAHAGDPVESVKRAGALWALWDLAGHVSDNRLAAQAIDLAQNYAADALAVPKLRPFRPLQRVTQLARRDVLKRHIPLGGFGPRHYAQLIWMAMTGR